MHLIAFVLYECAKHFLDIIWYSPYNDLTYSKVSIIIPKPQLESWNRENYLKPPSEFIVEVRLTTGKYWIIAQPLCHQTISLLSLQMAARPLKTKLTNIWKRQCQYMYLVVCHLSLEITYSASIHLYRHRICCLLPLICWSAKLGNERESKLQHPIEIKEHYNVCTTHSYNCHCKGNLLLGRF